jgi:hypothetical protein
MQMAKTSEAGASPLTYPLPRHRTERPSRIAIERGRHSRIFMEDPSVQRRALAVLLAIGLASSAGLAMAARRAGTQAAKTKPDTPLFDNLGSLHHPVTTSSAMAQRYFD